MRFRVFGLLFVLAVLMSVVASATPATGSDHSANLSIEGRTIDTSVIPSIPTQFTSLKGMVRGIHRADEKKEQLIIQDHFRMGDARGRWIWDPTKVELYRVPKYQEGEKTIEGTAIRGYLFKYTKKNHQDILNATVLEWFLAHRDQIPEEWKDKFVFFWGTVYRLPSTEEEYVRCLFWTKSEGWKSVCHLIADGKDHDFRANMPAAVMEE